MSTEEIIATIKAFRDMGAVSIKVGEVHVAFAAPPLPTRVTEGPQKSETEEPKGRAYHIKKHFEGVI